MEKITQNNLQKKIASASDDILDLVLETGVFIDQFSTIDPFMAKVRTKTLLGKARYIREKLNEYEGELDQLEESTTESTLISRQILVQNLLMLEENDKLLHNLDENTDRQKEVSALVQKAHKIIEIQDFKEALRRERKGHEEN